MTDAVGAHPPRRRWLIVALTVSLALNLFLVGVFAGSMHHRHGTMGPVGPHERFDGIAKTLNLNDAQHAAFGQFEAAFGQHGGAMRRANATIWAKIADPATKPDQIAALMNATVANRTQFQQDVATALAKFLATLTPEQRATFIEEARRPGHRHGRH